MKALFRAGTCAVRLRSDADAEAILAIYRQSEDFLSLGPVAKASMEMVIADIQHSGEAGGLFCVIEDALGNRVGVLDFVPEYSTRTALLSLLMISREHRHRGYGTAVVAALESYLVTNYQTDWIESGVQTNNGPGIRFWTNRGFAVGHTPRVIGDGTVAFEMRKQIAHGA